ncbi:MAG: hypothetical protein HWN65_04930 [Candidatus Helarchaeota archaeon]|nr:hypothetical protein [Candidatus Helarchaeota archaeon]
MTPLAFYLLTSHLKLSVRFLVPIPRSLPQPLRDDGDRLRHRSTPDHVYGAVRLQRAHRDDGWDHHC